MPQVFVAAGSNVDPERNLARACRELRQSFPDIRFSSCYRNRAVGFEGPDFLNLAAGFPTSLQVGAVVERLREIEAVCGRPRNAPKWAPRAMDLDILLYDSLVLRESGLELPRPDLLKRAYMLGPLAEIAPDVPHPTAGATIGELWSRFDAAAHPLVRVDVIPECCGPHPPQAPAR